MTMFIPATGAPEAAAMADASHSAHAHDRHASAENLAELKAMQGRRRGLISKLLVKLHVRR